MKPIRTLLISTILCAVITLIIGGLWIGPARASGVLTGGTPPWNGPAPGEKFTSLSSGLFVYSKTDLTVGGSMPLRVARVYRSRSKDVNKNWLYGDFGLGTRMNYDIFLYSQSEQSSPPAYTDAQVIMPDGGRIMCQRTSTCSQNGCIDYTDAVFTCDSQPVGIWFGSTISYDPGTFGWDLKRRDGTVYSFGLAAPLQSIKDRYGNKISISHQFAEYGPITKISSSDGRYVQITLDPTTSYVTHMADNSGRGVDYSYYNNGTLKTVTYSSVNASAATTYQYNQTANTGIGDLTTIILNVNQTGGSIAKNFNYITYGTDYRVNGVSSTVQSGGYTYAYRMDSTGSYIQECDLTLPDNSQRTLTFDSGGYVLTDTRNSGGTPAEETTYSRDASDRVVGVLDPLGRTISYQYDNLGNLTNKSIRAGVVARWDYYYEPIYSRVDMMFDPVKRRTRIQYNDSSNPTTAIITDNMNRTTTIDYNQSGQVVSVTDPLKGPPITFGYAPVSGDLTSVSDSLGNTTTYSTDAIGRVIAMTSPLREATTYSYDANGGVLSSTDGDGNRTAFQYDFLGDLTQITDPLGNITTISIPATLDKSTVCDPAGNCASESKDTMGRRVTVIDKRGVQTTYHYDKLGRVSSVVFNSNNKAGFNNHTVTYAYDLADRVTNITDSLSGSPAPSITLGYDFLDNVTLENSSEGSVASLYDFDSEITSLTVGSQPATSYSYDLDGELHLVFGGAAHASFSYDADGRRTSQTIIGVAPNGVTTNYGYDAASRLTSQSYLANGNSLGNLTYSYDPDSRLTQEGGSLAALGIPSPIGPNTYYATNQINTWNGVQNNPPDSANNLTADPSWSTTLPLTWDERNLLSSATLYQFCIYGGCDTDWLAFAYDAPGRRAGVQTNATGSNPTWTDYLYDNATVAQSSTPGGGPQNNYLTMPGGEVLAFTTTSGSATSTMVPLQDRLGSTVALVDSTGNLVTQYKYEPYGNPTISGQASAYPFLFAGMEHDSSSGLYHTLARYYDPRLGRFLSEDPLGIGGGDANLFAYVGDDPVNATDPHGECEPCVIPVLLVVAAAGVGVDAWWDPFGLFSGGGSNPTPRKELHRAHTAQGLEDAGASIDLIAPQGEQPSWPDEAANGGNFQFIRFLVPFRSLPQDPNDSPGEGWVQNGRNWWNPQTGQSLSPNFAHPPPIGPHYDLHNRYPKKWKLRLRPNGPTIEFWSEDMLDWLPLELLPE